MLGGAFPAAAAAAITAFGCLLLAQLQLWGHVRCTTHPLPTHHLSQGA